MLDILHLINKCCLDVSGLTALLIWRLNVVAIANEGADSVINTVSVGFLSSLVQQVVRYQTRVSLIHDVLRSVTEYDLIFK